MQTTVKQDVARLELGIALINGEIAAHQHNIDLINSVSKVHPLVAIERQINGHKVGIAQLEKRLRPITVEYDRLMDILATRLKSRLSGPTPVVATVVKTVMDLERKPPQKNPGRRYLPKAKKKTPEERAAAKKAAEQAKQTKADKKAKKQAARAA